MDGKDYDLRAAVKKGLWLIHPIMNLPRDMVEVYPLIPLGWVTRTLWVVARQSAFEVCLAESRTVPRRRGNSSTWMIGTSKQSL